MTRRMCGKFTSCLYATTAIGLVMAGAASAQQSEGGGLQEIIVTAQKRASTVQDTPMSITAVTGEDLADRGITDFSALAAATPGISMKANGPGQTEFEMRGMTSSGGNSPTVGFYLDDVPLTSPAAAQNGKVVIDPALYDLNRVEVLRGPQGTLYGSGSMGGTIKLVSNQPNLTQYQASAELTGSGTDGGGFNHAENVMANIPIIEDKLALRIVGSESYTSGWIDRIALSNFPLPTNGGYTRGNVLAGTVTETDKNVNDTMLSGFRATVTWKPTDNLTITPSVFYQKVSQGGPSSFDSPPGGPSGTLAHYEPYLIQEPYADLITIYNLSANYTFDGFDITSVTSKWRRNSTQTQDATEDLQSPAFGFNVGSFYGPGGEGPVAATEIDPSWQISEEVRIASNGDGPLKWVGGFFYSGFYSDWNLYTSVPNPAAFGVNINNLWNLSQPTKVQQDAVFGEATYAITDQLKLTGGLRWFYYRSVLDMQFSGFGSPTGDNTPIQIADYEKHYGINPKIDLSYEPDKDLTLYATAAKGFRPGGGNQQIPTTTASPIGPTCAASLQALGLNEAPPTYGPDSLWSYEAGEKAKLFNNRISVNGSFYYENWYHVQLTSLPCSYPIFVNGNNARIYGSELEIHALVTDELVLNLSGGYTNAELTQNSPVVSALKGDPLPDVPPWTGNIGLSYTHPLNDKYTLTARAENTYTGTRIDVTSANPKAHLPAYDLANLRFGVMSEDGWSAALFANNIFNKRAWLENTVQLSLGEPSFNRVQTNQPLTVGLDLTYHY